MIILNDLHLGAVRSAGTTPASALAMRQWMQGVFKQMLDEINETLIIQGDLFDTHTVSLTDLLAAYESLSQWLDKGCTLYLIPGNHDLSTDSSKLSSFQCLARLLQERSPKVHYIAGGQSITPDVYAISHVANQDLLNLELEKVPTCKYLLVHANFDNNFAKESDHSLNIDRQTIDKLPAEFVMFAHEHNHKIACGGKVFIMGNQFPASVSDCLAGEDKFMHRIGNEIDRIKTWSTNRFIDQDWRSPEVADHEFVRISGTATPEEAVVVMDTVARYRKMSNAFVVSNAVRIGNNDLQDEMETASLEQTRSFDVMAALKKYLTVDEYKIVENLT